MKKCGNPKCNEDVEGLKYSRGCGARICPECRWHQGLARCYCGWAANGGDGRQQLVDLGENLDEDY